MMRATFLPFAISRAFGALALGMTLIIPRQVPAAPQTVEEIANYKGADRQSILETGTKKEGRLQIYTTFTQNEPMDAFRQKYPYIRVEVLPTTTTGATRRMMEEYKAGRHVVDLINQPTAALMELRNAGLLQPYHSPEMEKLQPDAVEADHYWADNYHSFVGLGFNTNEVSAAEAPRTYEDLLDPKWKGKMAVTGRPSALPNFVGTLLLIKGEDYVRRLGQQEPTVYDFSAQALANLIVSGEVALSPQVYSSHLSNSKRKGAPVEWRPLGPVFGQINGAALAKSAPNPHAAMLFNDFILSREGQMIMQMLGYSSPRTDLASEGTPEKVIDLYSQPNYQQEFEKWDALAGQVFKKSAPGKKN